MIDRSIIKSIVNEFRLPGARFEVMEDQVSPGVFGVLCFIGDATGRDAIWWRTNIDVSHASLRGDNEALYEAITRPIKALIELSNEAQHIGFVDGEKFGRKMAIEAVQLAAGAFADAINKAAP